MAETLLIGFGNPGRLDDGLGPACAREIEALAIPGLRVESNYQLNVEDAALLAQHDAVVFADATVSGEGPFEFTRVEPAAELSFSTHSVSPGALVTLARDLYGATPRVFMLAIRGYEFNEFEERLSDGARANLHAAVGFIARTVGRGLSEDVAGADAGTIPDAALPRVTRRRAEPRDRRVAP